MLNDDPLNSYAVAIKYIPDYLTKLVKERREELGPLKKGKTDMNRDEVRDRFRETEEKYQLETII